MNTLHSLDYLEQDIVNHMSTDQRIGDDALKIFLRYKPVFDKFQVYHRTPAEYAKMFVEAYLDGYTPEMWLNRIHRLRQRLELRKVTLPSGKKVTIRISKPTIKKINAK